MVQPAFVGSNSLKFGSVVKNKITDKEGIVTAKFYLLSGCVTVFYTSQKEVHSDTRKPVMFYDTVDKLEYQYNSKLFPEQPVEESNFKLGEKVKCEALGVTGIVSSIGFYPDQANHLEIQPPYNEKEGKLPDLISVCEALVTSLENPPQPKREAARRPSPPSPTSERSLSTRDH